MGRRPDHKDRESKTEGIRLRRMIRGYAEFELLAKFFRILWDVFTNRKTWPPEAKNDVDIVETRSVSPLDNLLAKTEAPDGAPDPGLARGLYRLAVLFVCIVIVVFFFWNTYSTTASINRLSATAKNFPYAARCDESGNRIDTGQPNCVDLPNYVFINGPVLKAFRKACPGGNEPAEMLVLEKGKAPRRDIVRVEKSLSFHVRNTSPMPCHPYRRSS